MAKDCYQIAIAEDGLPVAGLVRRKQFEHVLPMCWSTWLRGVERGRFPRPVRLGPATVAWRVADIRKVLNGDLEPAEVEGA